MTAVSVQTLERLPLYLRYLKSLDNNGPMNVSAKRIADSLGLGEIQVRKDLAAVSTGGRPKIGYIINYLIRDLEIYLGYDEAHDAVLIGAGKLGKALLSYPGFKDYGLNIAAAFDVDANTIDTIEDGKPIFSIEKLKDLCSSMKIHIGIITVPAKCAQTVCDMLVGSGIMAIWNFAPIHLDVPENVLVENENMAASLAILSKHLKEKIYN